MNFKIGDIVISKDKETHFLKKNVEYKVVGVLNDKNIFLDMGPHGKVDYQADWFTLVRSEPSPPFRSNPVDDPGNVPPYTDGWIYGIEYETSSPKASYVMKSWSHFFQAIKNGTKKHDLRKMDRDFKIGQYIVLQEFDNIKGEYTGESLTAKITYITSQDTPCAFSSAVLENGYAILSLEVVNEH